MKSLESPTRARFIAPLLFTALLLPATTLAQGFFPVVGPVAGDTVATPDATKTGPAPAVG